MASWDSTPDPYSYRRLSDSLGHRSYEVALDGRVLGVIVGCTISTDTKMGRLRRPGKGRPGFRAVTPARHSFSGTPLGYIGTYIERDRRRDAADDLLDLLEGERWGEPVEELYDEEFIARAVAHYAPEGSDG